MWAKLMERTNKRCLNQSIVSIRLKPFGLSGCGASIEFGIMPSIILIQNQEPTCMQCHSIPKKEKLIYIYLYNKNFQILSKFYLFLIVLLSLIFFNH